MGNGEWGMGDGEWGFWLYCIVLEYEPYFKNQEKWLNQKQELLNRLESLESGADAYLQLKFSKESDTNIDQEELMLRNRLFKAQLQVSFDFVQNKRELMQTNDLLSTFALSDPLTAVNNRRAFESELPRQISKAYLESIPLSLIILDIDYFKSVNDNYGHQVGDRTLQLLSSRIQHNLRIQDTLFRYGGEEFVIILSNTQHEEVNFIAQRLCRLIGEQPFNVDSTRTLTITISLGIASLKSGDDIQGVSLLGRADANLLLAKAAGRNRVITQEI